MELKRNDKLSKRSDNHFFRNGKSVIVRKQKSPPWSPSWKTKNKTNQQIYKTKSKPTIN